MNVIEWIILGLNVSLSLTTAGHALFFKRTPQSALGWVAVCLMFPFVGPFFYFLFGINRVQNRARKLEVKRPPYPIKADDMALTESLTFHFSDLSETETFTRIARMSDYLSRLPMLGGNRIEPLKEGESAYPAMLEAIENAEERLFLSTYIFDTDDIGSAFVDALARAAGRGVDVRVIVDGVGEYYSFPRVSALLRKEGIPHVRFLPPKLIPPMFHINLRNHRKILVADGDTGFTGGMNIRDRHMIEKEPYGERVSDIHFLFTGPVVRQLEQSFIEDWSFCTGQAIPPTKRPPVPTGEAVCRTIIDGPNEEAQQLSKILVGAIAAARKRVQIMTPYFLPSTEMVSIMQTTALRGIQVEIVLPEHNNLPFIQWAGNNMLADLLQYGVEVYFQPPPFIHSKIFLIDSIYAQIGSANIDPRSLLLNFELNVEIYHRDFAQTMSDHIDEAVKRSRAVTLEMIRQRSKLAKTRDAVVWLFSPYL
ncbi:MAG: cardiolipin synthase [Desulfosalsimonadaceae bacterium]